jgi:hypothetical protein
VIVSHSSECSSALGSSLSGHGCFQFDTCHTTSYLYSTISFHFLAFSFEKFVSDYRGDNVCWYFGYLLLLYNYSRERMDIR